MGYREDDLQPAPALMLLKMIDGFCITQMIAVAAKLGIADLLAVEPKSANELADATGTHPPSLYRLLRGLASLGIFAEDDEGHFGLTPLAEPLRSGVSDSVRAWAVFAGDPQRWQPWGDLLYSVTTGEDAFEHIFGVGNWEYRAQHPEASALFQEAMTSNSRAAHSRNPAGVRFLGHPHHRRRRRRPGHPDHRHSAGASRHPRDSLRCAHVVQVRGRYWMMPGSPIGARRWAAISSTRCPLVAMPTS